MRCPTCKRVLPEEPDPERVAFLPFCNQRCKLADLHGWLTGRYVVSDALPLDESEGRLPSEDE